jgi:hypothetical protein
VSLCEPAGGVPDVFSNFLRPLPMDTPLPSEPRRSLPRRWLNRLEVDRAVFYAIATRAWQFLAGAISILVIAEFFSPELQGYFYTFASLMGMQTLVELGLHGVIINVSSHEWSQLHLTDDGHIAGDAAALQRLGSLQRFVARWYAGVAVIFIAVCGVGGAVFLNQRPSAGVAWLAPWCWLVALNGLLLWAWAFSAMLEGCNQMIVVNRVRLLQFATGSFAVWISMACGLGLWAAVVSVAVRLLWDFWLIAIRYRRFWQSLTIVNNQTEFSQTEISWHQEIWPLQWKTAVLGVTGTLAFGLFTPVMFYYHGLVVAGRMGLTWTILTAIESAAYAWVQVRTPLFGMLAARRDWTEMDRVFRRLTAISYGFYALGVASLCGGVWVLGALPFALTHRLSERILPVDSTAVFAVAFLLLYLPRCQAIYIRAHKRDPFLLSGIVSHGLIATLVIVLGRRYGPIGAACGLLVVTGSIHVPWWTWIWFRCRHEWHDSTVRPEMPEE